MTEDRDKWRKYVHGVANPRIEEGLGTEQNSYLKTYELLSEVMLVKQMTESFHELYVKS